MRRPLRILVACERSGIVRQACRELGHDAWSNDLVPADDASPYHLIGDGRDYLDLGWDALIAHPVCRRMTNAGARWLKVPPPGKTADEMWDELRAGAELFNAFWTADIPMIAIENPVMHKHARALIRNWQKPQTVQPWWFGEKTFKATCWWLKGLPPLRETDRLTPPKPGTDEHKKWSWVHRASPGEDRERIRSKFHRGMAVAMAAQWFGDALHEPHERWLMAA